MKRSGSRGAIVAVFLVGAVIFGGAYYAWNTISDVFQPVDRPGTGRTVHFEVLQGETTAQIADRLQQQGLIRDPVAFRVWARVKGLDKQLQAGIYDKLNSSISISEIIDQLLNAQPDAVRVVLPEGWRLEQIAQKFADSDLAKFKKDVFLKYARNIAQFPDANKYPMLKEAGGKGMEGLLFPSSYEVPVNADARAVLNLMLKKMQDTISGNKLDKLAAQNKMSVYKMLIMASIVERETGFAQDRGNIASVYWNRIYRPNAETVSLLNADPTVQYGRDTQNPPKSVANYWSPLKTVGSQTAPDSPWNTYNNPGFPPTPICSPGLASLQAAAAPPKTDYYYFLAKKDGRSVFAKTAAEFEQLKQQNPS